MTSSIKTVAERTLQTVLFCSLHCISSLYSSTARELILVMVYISLRYMTLSKRCFMYDYRLILFFLSVKRRHISRFVQTRLYFSFIKTLCLPQVFFFLFDIMWLKLIFGSSFSMNLSDSVHLCMCKKHFRVYCGLLSDLCQTQWCLHVPKLFCQHLRCQMFSLFTPGSSVT